MRYNSKILNIWFGNEFFNSVWFSLIDQNSITPKTGYKSNIDFSCVYNTTRVNHTTSNVLLRDKTTQPNITSIRI